jgi:hypothetical protein
LGDEEVGQDAATPKSLFIDLTRRASFVTGSEFAPRSLVSARFASPTQSNPIRRDGLTPRSDHGPRTN